MATVDFSKLTVLVHTCQRPKSLKRLLKSIRKFSPELAVKVADDSPEAKPSRHVDLVQLPANSGRGACLNALLARVRTPYFLLLDEQAELHRNSALEHLLPLLAEDKLDVAAGSIIACKRRLAFFLQRKKVMEHGIFEFAGDRLTLHRGDRSQGEGFHWCDLVGDFFLARTNKVRMLGGWDQELHNDGREEFFVRAHRQGLRVGMVPESSVYQWQEPAPPEAAGPDQRTLAVAKMGLISMVDFDGIEFRAPRRAQAA